MKYGILPEGLIIPQYEELLERYFSYLENKLGFPVDRSVDGPFGVLAEISCLFYLENWEAFQKFYTQYQSPEDVFLDIKASYIGLTRKQGIPSQCDIILEGGEGTVLSSGVIFKDDKNNQFVLNNGVIISKSNASKLVFNIPENVNGVLFSLTVNGTSVISYTGTSGDNRGSILNVLASSLSSNFTNIQNSSLDSDGNFSLSHVEKITPFSASNIIGFGVEEIWSPGFCIAQEVGDIEVPVGRLNTIDSPVPGLNEVTNPLPAQRGNSIETDAQLRQKMKDQKRVIGGASLSAIQAKIYENMKNISFCKLFENVTMDTDVNGLPPKSILLVIEGGNPNDIAKYYNSLRPAGIETYGSQSVIVEDSAGQTSVVKFSRTIPKYAHLRITITEKNFEETYPVDAREKIRADIFSYCKNEFQIGDDLILNKLYIPIYQTSGIKSVILETAITSTPDEAPVFASLDIDIAPWEYLSFSQSSSRIIVND